MEQIEIWSYDKGLSLRADIEVLQASRRGKAKACWQPCFSSDRSSDERERDNFPNGLAGRGRRLGHA